MSPTPNPTDAAVQDRERTTWLLEEYKLLTAHCLHEDAQFKNTLVMFLTLNIGLLGFGSTSLSAVEKETRWIVPAAGVVLWLPWIPSLMRIRAFRSYFECRIRTIEYELHGRWS